MKIFRRLLVLAFLTGAGSLLLAELARPLDSAGEAAPAPAQAAPQTVPALPEVAPAKPAASAEPLVTGTNSADGKTILDGKDHKEVLDAKDYKEALPEVGEGPFGGPGSMGSSGPGSIGSGSPSLLTPLSPQILPPELPPRNDVTTQP